MFARLFACWFFYSWNLYIDFLMVKLILILFVELLACWSLLEELVECWFFFVKLVECWFFKSWKSYIDFSPPETDFVPETCCVLFLFMELAACWFFSSIYLYVDFSFRESYKLIFYPGDTNLLHVTCCMRIFFVELAASWFLFLKHVTCWLFSSWKLCIDFSHNKINFFHRISYVLIFFCVELIAC